jgi:phosphatidylglycerophosphate synthase
MKPDRKLSIDEIINILSKDRTRTNITRKYEQKLIAFLALRIPSWISSDMLTAIGFFGNIIVFLSFVLAAKLGDAYLLIGVFGYIVSWFGDSLDGRIAYFRNKPRKWYGFSLDLSIDWIGVILMGSGFVIYVGYPLEILGFCFVVLYGWEMLTALLRYKVIDKYSIDSGFLGPTEVRILVSIMLILEVLVKGSIIYATAFLCLISLISNIIDTRKILQLAAARDREEKEQKKDE